MLGSMPRRSRQRKAPIRIGEIRRLSSYQCTTQEAAAELGISHKTFLEMIRIDERAKAAWIEGREHGKVKIRKAQFLLAERNPAMAIFLGKAVLGQRDISTLEVSGRDGAPVETIDVGKLDQGERRGLRELLGKIRSEKK